MFPSFFSAVAPSECRDLIILVAGKAVETLSGITGQPVVCYRAAFEDVRTKGVAVPLLEYPVNTEKD